MFSSLIKNAGAGGLTVIYKYIAIAWAVVTAVLIFIIIIEYAIIKGYKADLTSKTADLTSCTEKNGELGRTVTDKDRDLATAQALLTECRENKDAGSKECSKFLDAIKSGCEGVSRSYRTAWENCELKLRECGGGVNEECNDFIRRSISPFYYDGVH